MAANLAQRGAGALRYLRLPTRVAHTNARRVIFPAANGRFSNPIATGIYPAAVGKLINSYATAANTTGATKKPKTTATKRKTTNGTKSAPKKKTTKKAASKKPAKPKKKKQLTEKQKAAKDAKELREKIKELKEASLTPPKRLADRAWTLSLTSKLGDALKTHPSGKDAFRAAADMAKAITEEEKEVRAPIPLGFVSLCLLTPLGSNSLRKRKPTKLPTRPPTKHGLNRTPLYRSRRQTRPAAGLRELKALLFLFLRMTDWSSAPERLTFCTFTNEPMREISNTWLSRMSLPRWQRNGRV